MNPYDGGSFYKDETGKVFHRCPVTGKPLNTYNRDTDKLPMYAKKSDIPTEMRGHPKSDKRGYRCAEEDAEGVAPVEAPKSEAPAVEPVAEEPVKPGKK